jgi:hypothetical protein
MGPIHAPDFRRPACKYQGKYFVYLSNTRGISSVNVNSMTRQSLQPNEDKDNNYYVALSLNKIWRTTDLLLAVSPPFAFGREEIALWDIVIHLHNVCGGTKG